MKESINWKYYFEGLTRNSLSREEFERFLKLVEEYPDSEALHEQLSNHWATADTLSPPSFVDWEENFSRLLHEAEPGAAVVSLYNNKKRALLIKRVAVACMLVLLGGYFGVLAKRSSSNENSKASGIYNHTRKNEKVDVNKAVLTLADGTVINLGSAKNGTLVTQGNIKVIKSEDGQLLYYRERENTAVAGYNTISTPRGGTYELVLSDGTKVWLNAASSLRFPAFFKGKTREVTLTGEGYFEVAKNASMPFHVNVKGLMIEVLGTHFNINAYEDESAVSTTLLEGSVKVKKALTSGANFRTLLLKPGEQANLSKEGGLTLNHHADLKGITAWKEDNFEFTDAHITDIMRQVSRWYDVEVQYTGAADTRKITGRISRNVDLEQLVDMLRYAGVNMKIENKKIIIKNS